MGIMKQKGNLVKAKQKKLTAKDIREDIMRIQKAINRIEDTDSGEYKALMKELEEKLDLLKRTKVKVTARDIQDNIGRIMNAMKLTPEGSDEYERLAKELEHEYTILRKYKDSRFYIEPKMWATIGGTAAVLVLFICLEREVPSATKFASMVMKMMPFRG